MKKLLFSMILLAGVAFQSNAQDSTGVRKHKMSKEQRKEKKKEMKEKMKKELALTPEQEKQMKEINAGAHDEIKAIKNDPNLDEAAKKEKMKALKESKKSKVKEVLTDEQEAKAKKLHQEFKAKNKDRKHKRG